MQFPAMRQLCIATGSAFLLVYSLDEADSLIILQHIVEEICEIRSKDISSVPIVFALNKSDLPARDHKLNKDIADRYFNCEIPSQLCSQHFECSSKTGYNIDEIFRTYMKLAKVSLPMSVTPIGNKSGHKLLKFNTNSTSATALVCSTQTASGRHNINNLQQQQQQLHIKQQLHLQQQQQQHQRYQQKRPSFRRKITLSVRKSCDASITSIRNSLVESFRSPPLLACMPKPPNYWSSQPSTPEHGTSRCISRPHSSVSAAQPAHYDDNFDNWISNELCNKTIQLNLKSSRSRSSAETIQPHLLNTTSQCKSNNTENDDLQADRCQNHSFTTDQAIDDKIQQGSEEQINLNTAIQNELIITSGKFVDKGKKQRSKSLIWRSTRRKNTEVCHTDCVTT